MLREELNLHGTQIAPKWASGLGAADLGGRAGGGPQGGKPENVGKGPHGPGEVRGKFQFLFIISIIFVIFDVKTTLGTHGNSWESMGIHGVPMGTHGNPWEPMGTHGNPWGTHGNPWGTHGNPWISSMDIINGYHPCILSMDIIHGYHPWIISMGNIHG